MKIIVLKGVNVLKENVIVMKDFKEWIVQRKVVKVIVVSMVIVMMESVNVSVISMDLFVIGRLV